MWNPNNRNSIGDPQPVDPSRAWGFVEFGAISLAVVAGGLLAFASSMVPARAKGGTRSARVIWQQQAAQVQNDTSIAQSESADKPTTSESTRE